MRSRIKASSVAAVAVLAAAAMFHGSAGAHATQGQAIAAGVLDQTETHATAIYNTNSAYTSCGFTADENSGALQVCGSIGLVGNGTSHNGVAGTGVEGDADVYGVRGIAPTAVYGDGTGAGSTGVYGEGTYAVHGKSTSGWGVWGEGTDRGVYGVSANEGVVGFSNNVGIRAESPNIALRVKGKAEFSRSGTVTISYPNKQATVTGVPVTAKSLAFATLQRFLAGRYVLAAVPNLGGASNSFTIYLNKAPGSSSTPKSVVVGWQVIEKP